MSKKWTAKADPKVKSWDRVRFKANEEDYRCVPWPPMGPYWCSGFGDNYAIVVAYVPHGTTNAKLKKYWPEAKEVDRMKESIQIEFSDRFAKPDWWIS